MNIHDQNHTNLNYTELSKSSLETLSSKTAKNHVITKTTSSESDKLFASEKTIGILAKQTLISQNPAPSTTLTPSSLTVTSLSFRKELTLDAQQELLDHFEQGEINHMDFKVIEEETDDVIVIRSFQNQEELDTFRSNVSPEDFLKKVVVAKDNYPIISANLKDKRIVQKDENGELESIHYFVAPQEFIHQLNQRMAQFAQQSATRSQISLQQDEEQSTKPTTSIEVKFPPKGPLEFKNRLAPAIETAPSFIPDLTKTSMSSKMQARCKLSVLQAIVNLDSSERKQEKIKKDKRQQIEDKQEQREIDREAIKKRRSHQTSTRQDIQEKQLDKGIDHREIKENRFEQRLEENQDIYQSLKDSKTGDPPPVSPLPPS
jgi:hypothetical protein